MRRSVAGFGAFLTLALPYLLRLNNLIGVAGLPADLRAWGVLLGRVVAGYTVLDWALFPLGVCCFLYAIGLWPSALTRHGHRTELIEQEDRADAGNELPFARGMRLAREARELGLELRQPAPDPANAFRARVAKEEAINAAVPADMPLPDVVSRVAERLGNDPVRIHEAIIDAAFRQHIDVWGRLVAGKPVKRVWTDAWEGGDFSLEEGTVVYRPPDNPNAEYRWTGLMFNRRQVDWWMPPDLGPNGWMAR